MLKLNNITIGKLIDIKLDENRYVCKVPILYNKILKLDEEQISTKDKEQISTKIAELFLDDGLDELYKVTSESKNLYNFPWSEPSSELLLKKGHNFIWFESLNQIQIKNSSNIKIETINS